MNYKNTNNVEYVQIDFPSYYERYTSDRIEDIEHFILNICSSINGFRNNIVKVKTIDGDYIYLNTQSIVQFFVKHYN